MKKSAGVAEVKANLSRYLEQVKAGREVLITERGNPVAKLVPLERAATRESREDRLARRGLLVLGRGRFSRALLTPPEGDPSIGAGVLAALIEDRREGR
jgi:prevent-host-death family protein